MRFISLLGRGKETLNMQVQKGKSKSSTGSPKEKGEKKRSQTEEHVEKLWNPVGRT